MSRRREAQELAVALELSTQQQSSLITGSSISLVTPVSDPVVNSKDLELVEGNTMVGYAARGADVVADSEEEEEIEIPIDTPLTGPQRIAVPFIPSSIKSFTPSFIQPNALEASSAPPMTEASPITPFGTSSEHQLIDILPPLPSSEKKASSPIHPTVSPTVLQTLPSPRTSPKVLVEPLESSVARTSSKPTTYGAKKSSRMSITPHNPAVPLPEENVDIQLSSSTRDGSLSSVKPPLRKRAKVIEDTDSEGEFAAKSKASATTDQQPALATPKRVSDDTDFEQDRPESSTAASKRSSAKPSKKRTAVIESDEEVEDVGTVGTEQASRPTMKRFRAEAVLSPSARNEQRGSSPDPLAMQSRSTSPPALTRAKPSSSTSKRRDSVEYADGTTVASEQIVTPAVEAEAVTVPSTGKGKKGKAAKGKAKAKATPKAKAASKDKGKGKPTATQAEPVIGEAEREAERPVPVLSAEEVVAEVDAKSSEKEKEKTATPPPEEPVRPPLSSLRTDANRLHTPTRGRLQSDSPGPSKLGTGSKPILRTPQGLPLVVAKFGGTKQTGMSRRLRLPSLHTKIKTPPKALPPAPIKPVRKKKGEESDDDDDEEEFDADGNVVKKVKVKGMEWYMMED